MCDLRFLCADIVAVLIKKLDADVAILPPAVLDMPVFAILAHSMQQAETDPAQLQEVLANLPGIFAELRAAVKEVLSLPPPAAAAAAAAAVIAPAGAQSAAVYVDLE
jgi:hypothetical protein